MTHLTTAFALSLCLVAGGIAPSAFATSTTIEKAELQAAKQAERQAAKAEAQAAKKAERQALRQAQRELEKQLRAEKRAKRLAAKAAREAAKGGNVASVPELDGGQAGMALALAGAMLAWRRERALRG